MLQSSTNSRSTHNGTKSQEVCSKKRGGSCPPNPNPPVVSQIRRLPLPSVNRHVHTDLEAGPSITLITKQLLLSHITSYLETVILHITYGRVPEELDGTKPKFSLTLRTS